MTSSRHILALAAATMLGTAAIASAPARAVESAPATQPGVAGNAGERATALPTQPGAASKAAQRFSPAAIEARIKRLHDQLKITPAESEQWSAVAQIMRDNEKHIAALIKARDAKASSMSALDNLKSYQKITEAHEEGLNKLVPAFATLYDAMPAQQQKTADAVFSAHNRARTGSNAPPAPVKPAEKG